jgi:hypothetical protein
MSESDRVLIEVVVAAPIETVWKALRDPAEIRRWFGWDYAGLDEEIALIFSSGASASEADHVVRFPDMNDRFELTPRGEQTVVRVIRAAPAGDSSWQDIYDDVVEGWVTFVQQLRFALARHRGENRRTLYLSGRATNAGNPLPVEALGLNGVRTAPEGKRYAANIDTGDALAGDLWFRSRYQIGLSVDTYGNGLLIVGDRPTTSKSPHGGGTALITTYGFDNASFDRLRQRWTEWWRAHYETIEVQCDE